MNTLQSQNQNSENSIQQELSPLNSKETTETKGPDNNKSKEFMKKLNGLQENSTSSAVNKVDVDDILPPLENADCTEDMLNDIVASSNDEDKKKKETSPLQTSNSSKLNRSNSKISNVGKNAASTVVEAKEVKRKRTAASDQRRELSINGTEIKGKRAKMKNTNDNFCWRCHKEVVDAKCRACPRSWHRKCMGGPPPTTINETWICGECATILRAENAETRSEIMAHFSIDHLCMLLKYIVERMRSCQGSEPFWKAVDLNEVPNYMDYVVRPMDLDLLESNVRSKLYGSTDAFMADAKWIQHNCIVFNTCGGVYADTSKLTNAARQIIKIAKQEVAEIEACPDCYVRGRNLPRPHPSWFIEPCRKPHPLIWAKLKGFPFWPAKAMPRVNGQGHVDVRFFGQHDRAWVAPKDVYLYSREPPTPFPRKRKVEMAECIKEISRHARKLEIAFGPFQYAPSKTPYNPQDPMQIKIMLPQYDPLHSKDNVRPPVVASRRKSPFFKRTAANKRKLEADSTINEISAQSGNTSLETSDLHSTNSETIVDSMLTESARPKKRQKKSATNNDIMKSQDEASELVAPVSAASVTSISSDAADEVSETIGMRNGTSEVNPNVSEDDKGTLEDETGTRVVVPSKSKETSEKVAVEKKNPLKKSLAGLLRTVNEKGRYPHPRNSNSEVVATPQCRVNSLKLEAKTNSTEVYKPKARMVDKVNAEKALNSTMRKAHNTGTDASKLVGRRAMNGLSIPVTSPGVSVENPAITARTISVLHKKCDNDLTISNSILKAMPKKPQSRIVVVSNGAIESMQFITPPDDARAKKESPTVLVKQDPNSTPQTSASVQPKQSRAKKSFPNKPPRLPHLLPKLPKLRNSHTKPLDSMVYIPAHGNEDGLDYQLPPPEAGPLSAQLHRGATELAKRMGQLLEEAVRLAADPNFDEIGDSVDNHQATIHSLRLQIERMGWQHQQQLAELKHNTDRTLREMRASLEAERLRVIEEVRREAEEERTRCVGETKTKQWCAHCGREALFYCCWNTAYCDHLCQQAHWQAHQRKCAQKPSLSPLGSGSASDSTNQQQQIDRDSSGVHPSIDTQDVSKTRSTCLSPTIAATNFEIS